MLFAALLTLACAAATPVIVERDANIKVERADALAASLAREARNDAAIDLKARAVAMQHRALREREAQRPRPKQNVRSPEEVLGCAPPPHLSHWLCRIVPGTNS